MTNHCTPRFFKALNNLEHNYPEVFATYSKLQLDDVASPLDPDFRIVKDFRDTIRESDWSKYHSDHGLQAEIASCLHRYMGVHEIAEYLGMDAKMIGNRSLKKSSIKAGVIFRRSLSMTATMAIIHSCGRCIQQHAKSV